MGSLFLTMDSSYLTFGSFLIGAGFLLLLAELFVMSGILLVLALSGIAVGVVLIFYYDTTTGVFTMLGVFVAFPILARFLLHYWPRSSMGRRFFLTEGDEDATVAFLPLNQELEQLKGRFGRTLSDLRPAGVVDFDGRRVDTLSEGMMIEAGQWVRCIEVRAGKVIVRAAEKPALEDLEAAEFE